MLTRRHLLKSAAAATGVASLGHARAEMAPLPQERKVWIGEVPFGPMWIAGMEPSLVAIGGAPHRRGRVLSYRIRFDDLPEDKALRWPVDIRVGTTEGSPRVSFGAQEGFRKDSPFWSYYTSSVCMERQIDIPQDNCIQQNMVIPSESPFGLILRPLAVPAIGGRSWFWIAIRAPRPTRISGHVEVQEVLPLTPGPFPF